MSSYRNVIKQLSKFNTTSAHVNGLTNIKNKSQDIKLNKAIDVLVLELMGATTSNNNKSTKITLDKSKKLSVTNLMNICNAAISSEKPEWQIMAEKNGWTPPPKP